MGGVTKSHQLNNISALKHILHSALQASCDTTSTCIKYGKPDMCNIWMSAAFPSSHGGFHCKSTQPCVQFKVDVLVDKSCIITFDYITVFLKVKPCSFFCVRFFFFLEIILSKSLYTCIFQAWPCIILTHHHHPHFPFHHQPFPFQPHVTAVACKRPQSFCQKCRRQFTPEHAYKHPWHIKVGVDWLCRCPARVWESIRKRAHMQLVREHSVTVVSAHWATVDWSWTKEWN